MGTYQRSDGEEKDQKKKQNYWIGIISVTYRKETQVLKAKL